MPIKLDRHRLDGFADELADVVIQRPDLFRHAQIIELVFRVEAVGGGAGHVGVFHETPPGLLFALAGNLAPHSASVQANGRRGACRKRD